MKWFQVKEKSAGKNRLILTYHIYRIFGMKAVRVIAFMMGAISFLLNRDLRNYSKKVLTVIHDFSNTSPKPTYINQFRHVLSYASYLADKLQIFCGDFDYNNLIFESEKDKELLCDYFNNKKAIFFITTHLGNVEVLRSFLTGKNRFTGNKINVFLNFAQTKIFNEFMEKIGGDVPVKIIPVEDIDITTSIKLKENIDNGEFVFMAGDRISSDNDSASNIVTMFNKKVKFPIGTFKLAQLLEAKIYFVIAIKIGENKYNVYLKNVEFDKNLKNKKALHKMQQELADFLQEKTMLAPLQFFHFYDMFE